MTTPTPQDCALRTALQWTAGALQAIARGRDRIRIGDEIRTVDEVLDAANAALEAPQPGWLPISEAPKDGRTLLLGYFNSHGKWRTTRGEWLSEEFIEQYAEDPDMMKPGWHETTVEDDEGKCWLINPTHYMPLPPPPSTKGEPT